MTNISTAYGTVRLYANSKRDIIDFIKLQKESEKKEEYKTTILPPKELDKNITPHKEGYTITLDIHGTSSLTFDFNMEYFFKNPFRTPFEEIELSLLQKSLKTKSFAADFHIINYSPSLKFLSKVKFVTIWEHAKTEFYSYYEASEDYTAANCREIGLYDDPYDPDFALRHFNEFILKVRRKYNSVTDKTVKEILIDIIDNKENTQEHIKKMQSEVSHNFDSFLNKLIFTYIN